MQEKYALCSWLTNNLYNVKQLLNSVLFTQLDDSLRDCSSCSVHCDIFQDWVLTTRICPGLKLGDGQLSTGKEERNGIFLLSAPSSPESGTQSSGAAGKIDPITSAEGKVSILNDSLRTNKGRTPGPQPLRVWVCFDISPAHSWGNDTEFMRQQNNFYILPRVSLSV